MALEVARFRELFPAFADATQYPGAQVSGYFAFAECWLGEYMEGCPCGDMLYYLLAAHLLYTRGAMQNGASIAGIVTSSSVGGVSVSISTMPIRSAWQAWLAGSPYGLELWAFLRMKAGGGRYVGANMPPERAGFRKAGGTFGPGAQGRGRVW